MRRSSFVSASLVGAQVVALSLACGGCATRPEARSVREVNSTPELGFVTEIDATRLERDTGLTAVPSVARLLKDELTPFFRVIDAAPINDDRAELIAESPAPGYAVRVQVEARPDDFCVVSFSVVRLLEDGSTRPTALAPYSVHLGLAQTRAALADLRQVTWPALDEASFAVLRHQASDAKARGEDAPIDAVTFARTPRPLRRADEPVRYYAPVLDHPSMRD